MARVLCGDATSAAALARLLGERKCDLWFTERPYGIDSGFRDPSGNSFRLTQVREMATT